MAVYLQEGEEQRVANHLPRLGSESDQDSCSLADYMQERSGMVPGVWAAGTPGG